MVDHNQKGIKTIRKGKVSYQIAGDLLKGVGARGRDGKKWGSRRVCVNLMLLAGGTTPDITLNIRGKAWPPKFRGDQLVSLENPGVTRSGMVMVAGNDRMAEVGIGRDIDTSLVS